jgi:serine protease Do
MSSAVTVLLLFALPVSVFAEDEQGITALRRMGKAFSSIAEKTSGAVVGIKATSVAKGNTESRRYSFGEPVDPFHEDLFDYFFRRQSPRRYEQMQPRQVAQGSGFLVAPDGYILTNNHLVGEADEISVTVGDNRKYKAKVIGADPETDVAVIKIDAENMPFLELADSDALEVGEWVIAIGNPFRLSHTVTAGIVSAKGRSQIGVADYEDFIQTDAAINFGNSGGPLLNLDGKVVGINTAIIGPGGNVGIGLAIPINMAKSIYEQLKASGKVVRGYLGVVIQDLEPGMSEFFGVDNGRGALVASVMEDSAADKAGIKSDDIIVEIEGEAVTGASELMNRVAARRPDSKVKLVVLRDGERKTLTVILDKRPPGGPQAGSEDAAAQNQLGLSVRTLTEDLAERLGYENLSGVVVAEVESGSLAQEYGIEPGMLITEVNRQPVRNVRQFNEALAKAQKGGKVLLRVSSESGTSIVFIPLSQE